MHKHNEKPVIPDPKGYESEDLNLYPIFKWITILLVFVGVSSLITYWIIYKPYLGRSGATVGEASRFSTDRVLPAEPRLQAMPKVEMKDFRLMEKQKVEGYAWVDKQKGTVRIPIEKAMEMVAERGAEGYTLSADTEPAPKPAEETPTTESHGETSHTEGTH